MWFLECLSGLVRWMFYTTLGQQCYNWLVNPWVLPREARYHVPLIVADGPIHMMLSCLPGVITFFPVLMSMYGALLYHIHFNGIWCPDSPWLAVKMSAPEMQLFFITCWCLGISRLQYFHVISRVKTTGMYHMCNLVLCLQLDLIMQWRYDTRDVKILHYGVGIFLTPAILHLCEFLIAWSPPDPHTYDEKNDYEDITTRGMDAFKLYLYMQLVFFISFVVIFIYDQVLLWYGILLFKAKMPIYEWVWTAFCKGVALIYKA